MEKEFSSPKGKIYSLVSKGELNKAFKAIIELSSEQQYVQRTIILLSSEYHSTRSDYLAGIITRKQWLRERQGILLRMLELLEDIEASP
ncbi:hypothetical protein [Haliscomenobacter hydrossis]|uniref:hypothetical protein n=1 Tax=Haliscomenobacter hydrossis TaxID=2350 RepID=UPI003AF3E79F